MAYVALYRAYRPQSFNEVSGQEHIVKTLKNAIINNKVAHAYLFSGPRGTGKTTIAKIMAKAINCSNLENGEPCNECAICKGITKGMIPDVIEIDAASNNGVDEIRDIREKVKFLPSEGKYKVYIIDEVHMLSTGAFNALLKTLEEPPAHAVFILATTEVHKIPATILSRCQRFDFRGVGVSDIIKRIEYISKIEGININSDAIELIAECAEGGMRDALSLFDEAISYAGNNVSIKDVYQVSGSVDVTNLLELADSILKKEPATVLKSLETIIDLGKEIPKICTDLISFYRDMLIFKNSPKEGKSIYRNKDFIAISKRTSNNRIYFYLNVLNEAQNNMKFTNQKRTYLELALVKMSDFQEQQFVDFSDAISKLEKEIEDLKQQKNNVVILEPQVEKKEAILIERKDNVNYIETFHIENVLNNGNVNKKKSLINRLNEILQEKHENILLMMLKHATIVASNENEFIITIDKTSSCDYMMQKQMREKFLSLINKNEILANNYYAIPSSIWEQIINDYKNKYRSGDKKPKLNQIDISIRLYNEKEEKKETEMEALAHEIFGENVNFE